MKQISYLWITQNLLGDKEHEINVLKGLKLNLYQLCFIFLHSLFICFRAKDFLKATIDEEESSTAL